MSVNTPDSEKLQAYLRKTFKNDSIEVKARAKTDDSVEVLIDGEFIGVIYEDNEDGEKNFSFNMAILDMDLEDAA